MATSWMIISTRSLKFVFSRDDVKTKLLMNANRDCLQNATGKLLAFISLDGKFVLFWWKTKIFEYFALFFFWSSRERKFSFIIVLPCHSQSLVVLSVNRTILSKGNFLCWLCDKKWIKKLFFLKSFPSDVSSLLVLSLLERWYQIKYLLYDFFFKSV